MEENIIRLASLLHDIGKFWQGTGETGNHAELSLRFIQNYVPDQWQGAAGIVALHHDPSKYTSSGYKPLKTIICSDWLSSGERRKKQEDEERGERRGTPLKAIFCEIDIGKGDLPPARYYPIKKLDLKEEVIFPKPLEGEGEDRLKKDYIALWNEFVDEVERIKEVNDFDAYFNTLYHLLQKYTWCVPSAVWKDVPDVSLFDHLKTSCAIASCLYDSDENFFDNMLSGFEKRHKDEELNEVEKRALKDNKFLLIGGDVSGVQKFIYSITSKGAAKGLRGRSLYLDLLSESIAKYLLRVLQLPLTNLLYCGGGHFYILASSVAESDLKQLRVEIAQRLLEIHRGELYLVLDWLPLSADGFQKEKFGQAWEDLGTKLGEKKKSKFAEILEWHETIFGPIDKGGTINTCDICGTEERVEEKEDRNICSFCESFEKLASDIGEAQYCIETWKQDLKLDEREKGSWKAALALFGVAYEFEKSLKRDLKNKDADHIYVYTLNDTDFSAAVSDFTDAKTPTTFGFKFLTKNTPYKLEKEAHIKDFHEFAEDSEGLKRWGILRADVDDLGRIFSVGLGQNRTISRVSNLSSMLSLFFKGWIEKICEGIEYKERVYAIYSGGDDLFIVGSWNKIPELGKTLDRDFRAFTCTNQNITLSAGITIAPSKKFPLYQAADLAGEAVKKSKSLEGKDAVTFLEISMKWDKFVGAVYELKEKLIDLISAGNSRALLQKLYSIYLEYDKQSRERGKVLAKYDDRYGRWRWLLAWTVKGMRVSETKRALLEEIEKLILDRDNIEFSPVAIKWVEYLTRKEEVK